MCTSQEEADTILMLHAIDVASQNKNAAIHILSTDTDVLILDLAYFPTLAANPCMPIGHGKSREFIVLKPIYNVLGCPLVRALIGFHNFTGCDTAGRFSGKGKITCWKSFENFKGWQDNCLQIHWSWTGRHAIWSSNLSTLERYICQLYLPGTSNEDPGGCCSRKIKQSVKSSLPSQLKLHYTSTYSVPITRPEYGIWLTSLIQYVPHGWTNEEGCLCPVETLLKAESYASVD